MARIAEERLDAVRKYLHQVFPDWALAERWDGEHEAHSFLLKKAREPVHLLKVSRALLDDCGPRKLAGLLEGRQMAHALRKAEKHRLPLTERGLDPI
ncbi:MAG: hypothetical protein O2979_09745 [Proteobacteria bacterium]|nr:hypothetical protein [Pseudomonadota bacterium]